ncbi:hypothetical protein V1477_008407 [Vespula maculifrons]|uniref:Uncharacterized protein n=2 Tax=Vespula TaxID=7451 RepID=A0A834JL63_VESVU|nr:hypothetical protein HZH66_009363 [Vespula vulgaris]
MAGRYDKCLTPGLRTSDGDHWDNDIITGHLDSPGPHYHHTSPVAHADSLKSTAYYEHIFPEPRPDASRCQPLAFCQPVTKYDDP